MDLDSVVADFEKDSALDYIGLWELVRAVSKEAEETDDENIRRLIFTLVRKMPGDFVRLDLLRPRNGNSGLIRTLIMSFVELKPNGMPQGANQTLATSFGLNILKQIERFADASRGRGFRQTAVVKRSKPMGFARAQPILRATG